MNNQAVMINEHSKTIEEILNVKMHEIGGVRQETVDARDLHMLLENEQPFDDWIQDRIKQNSCFEEGFDYVSLLRFEKREPGATAKKEYILSKYMVSDLAFLENNSIGKSVWRYFSVRNTILQKLNESTLYNGINYPFKFRIMLYKFLIISCFIKPLIKKLMKLLRREAA